MEPVHSKERLKVLRLAYDALARVRAYHEMADLTGLRLVVSIVNLAERLHSWAAAMASEDALQGTAGSCAVFEGLAERAAAAHEAELAKQRRNLTVVLEALSSHQEEAFAARAQARELVEAARKGGTHAAVSPEAPVSVQDVARLVEGLAAGLAADLLSRAAIVTALQALPVPPVAAATASGGGPDAETVAALRAAWEAADGWAQAWQALDWTQQAAAARAEAEDTAGTGGSRTHWASPSGAVSLLAWKVSGKGLSGWLQVDQQQEQQQAEEDEAAR